MIEVQNQTVDLKSRSCPPNFQDLVKEVFAKSANPSMLSIEEYLVWTVSSPLPAEFARLIYQLCHIVIGLRPQNRVEEGSIVRGWLEREEKAEWVPGTVWYLISMKWWTQWHAYVNHQDVGRVSRASSVASTSSLSRKTDNTDNNQAVIGTSYLQLQETPQSSPCPQRKTMMANGTKAATTRPRHIDNSGLIQNAHRVTNLTGEGGKLRSDVKLSRGKDFEILPERLWKALFLWYGGSPTLPRQVIRTKAGKVELELNPLSIKLLRHQTTNRPGTANGGMTTLGNMASHGFSGGSMASAGSNIRRYHAYQGAFSRRTTIRKIEEFLSQRLGVKSEDMRLWFFKDDSNMSLLEDGSLVLEDAGFNDEDSILVEVRNSAEGTWPEEISSLCNERRLNNAQRSSSQVKGITGLNNLGNTCYMNAAIQCVSNTKILTMYFNNNCHDYELNRTNPLGYKGQIAKRFGDLVKEMWAAKSRSVAPIKMRWTIGHCNASFSGFQQQDSQELLAFLLDGLHEDLNRVTETKYVELRDSDGRPDIVVAQEAEENHNARNKSIIVDLFHGQLKSKVTCKVCGHESVTFDPFTYLSLPLPMESSVHIEVIGIFN